MTNKFGPKKTSQSQTPAEIKDSFTSPKIKKLTVDIDADLHQQLRLESVMEKRSMRSILEGLLEEHFRK